VIDLQTVRLTEGRSWLHAFPIGTYQHPEHGLLTFTPGRLQRIADGVNRGIRGIALALDYEHRGDAAKGGKAAGWIDWAEVRSDGLWLSVNFTAGALAEVRAGEWRYLSPEFHPSWTDPRTGVVHTDVLMGAALTNRPFLRDLAPIAASERAVHTRQGSPPVVGLAFGAGGRGGPAIPDRSMSSRAVGGESVPTRLSETVAAMRFYEVVGRHLGAGAMAFSDAIERASAEDPEGYAAYRASTYVDGGRA
jgi:Mu-like prophage I protein